MTTTFKFYVTNHVWPWSPLASLWPVFKKKFNKVTRSFQYYLNRLLHTNVIQGKSLMLKPNTVVWYDKHLLLMYPNVCMSSLKFNMVITTCKICVTGKYYLYLPNMNCVGSVLSAQPSHSYACNQLLRKKWLPTGC